MRHSHEGARRPAFRKYACAALIASLVTALLASIPDGALAAAPQGASGSLVAVDCPTPTTCVAVGSYRGALNYAKPFAGQSDTSTWKFAPAPVPAGGRPEFSSGVLAGVACPTAARCFAVGNYYDSYVRRTVIQQWDGAKWSIVSRIRPTGATASILSSISCPTSTLCLAVGSSVFDHVTKAFGVRWNGKTWSVLPMPREDAEARQSRLNSISCVSATSCFAAGHFQKGALLGQSLIERWNGTRWSVVASPNPPRPVTYVTLVSISCATAVSCSAVGLASDSLGEASIYEPVALRWNGTRWKIVPTPKPAGARSAYTFTGVSCPASGSCLAIGYHAGVSNNVQFRRALVERWDGKAWSVIASPADSVTSLAAITCRTSTSCVAVGGAKRTVIAQWNGTTWSIVAS